MILDLKSVVTNQVFMAIQSDLFQANIEEAQQREIMNKIQATINTSMDGLVDRVIKVVD
jgi:hypothetical protein